MKISSLIRAAIASCAIVLATSASAVPILQVNSDGILTGAKNVSINNILYNVYFGNGSCIDLFNGCNNSSFTFKTSSAVADAATVLLNSVFLNTPLGSFDSLPNKTSGCETATNNRCYVIIPYMKIGAPDRFNGRAVLNNNADDNQNFAPGYNQQPNWDSRNNADATFAVFRLASTDNGVSPFKVPEPTSIALMGLAFVGLVFSRRRKS